MEGFWDVRFSWNGFSSGWMAPWVKMEAQRRAIQSGSTGAGLSSGLEIVSDGYGGFGSSGLKVTVAGSKGFG